MRKLTSIFRVMAFVAVLLLCGCGASQGGYGSFDPNHITGEQLVRTGQSSVMGALEGLVPGLNIVGNGRGGYTANIRGVNSFYSDTTPLLIVDGVQVSSLDALNIYDVDYVEVDKTGSLYGSRGANGVIKVFTKKGPDTKGSSKVSVEYSTGVKTN